MKLTTALVATVLLSMAVDAQTPWNEFAVTPGPSIRERPAGASDGNVFYLSGGNDGTSASTIYGDLWSFDGATWTEITTTGAGFGPNRTGHAMVWDDARSKLVVFGGVTAPWPTRLSDTWEWDATSGWVDVTPATSPSARSFMAFAYVPGLGLVVHGGQQASTPHASDTWAWDGSAWTQLAVGGPERNVSAMAYRSAPANDLILFGGSTTSTSKLDETWRFDLGTSAWGQIFPPTSPAGAVGMSMHYNPSSGLIVMHGGNAVANPTDQTWTFGSDWVNATPASAGPTRRNMAAAYVSGLGKGVAACGHTGGFRENDIWGRGLVSPASFTGAQGTSCTSSLGLVATVSAAGPILGQPWTLTLNNTSAGAVPFSVVGFSNATWSGIPLPVPLSLLFAASPSGCQLQVRPNLIDAMVPGAGSARKTFMMPVDPALAGVAFYAQGVQAEFTTGISLVGSDYGIAVLGN